MTNLDAPINNGAWKVGGLDAQALVGAAPRARSRIALFGDSITANGFGASSINTVTGSVTSNGTTMSLDTGNAVIANYLVGNWVSFSKPSQPVGTPLQGCMRKVVSASGTLITMSAVCGNESFPEGTSSGWIVSLLQPANPGWFGWFNMALDNPFLLVGNYALGGYGTDLLPYIRDRAAAGPDFDVAAICIAHNDFAAGLSASSAFANTMEFVEFWEDKGKSILLVTPPAWSSAGASWSSAKAVENWNYAEKIRENCHINPGRALFDLHRATVDGTSPNGDFRAGYSVDGVHPNANGLYRAVRDYSDSDLAREALQLRKGRRPLPSALNNGSTAGTDNLLPNGHMSGGAGLPTGWLSLTNWSAGSEVLTGGIARPDLEGFDFSIAMTGVTGSRAVYSNFASRLAPLVGNFVEFGFECSMPVAPTLLRSIGARLFMNGGGWGGASVSLMNNGTGATQATDFSASNSDPILKFRSQPYFVNANVVAPSAAYLILDVGVSGASNGTLAFAKAFVRTCADPFA